MFMDFHLLAVDKLIVTFEENINLINFSSSYPKEVENPFLAKRASISLY